jgi:hypothetical protein
MKTNSSFYLGENFLFPSNAESYVSNDYYTFINHGIHFTNSKLNWGISAGMKFDKKNSLELVVSADGSSVSQSFAYYNLNPSYSAVEEVSFLWGREFFRLNTEYNRTFISKPSYDMRAMVGLGLFLLHNRTEVWEDGFKNDIFSANVVRTNVNDKSVVPIAQFGFGIDFKTKRNIQIFSFDVFATINFLNFFSTINRFRVNTQFVSYEVTLTDQTDGSTHLFSHTLASRGSGINFQLSRAIQFHPWRPNKKKCI